MSLLISCKTRYVYVSDICLLVEDKSRASEEDKEKLRASGVSKELISKYAQIQEELNKCP